MAERQTKPKAAVVDYIGGSKPLIGNRMDNVMPGIIE